MKTLEDIRGRCRMVDGHWIWAGALRPDGRANIYGPDYTKGGMKTQIGPRAVWHVSTGKPIPNGWRVYGNCDEPACVNPAHIECTSPVARGKHVQETGALKGSPRRILANRAIGRKRATLTPALIAEIQLSPETGVQLTARLGIGRATISKARRGEARAFQAAGLFSGLMGGANA